MLRKSYVGVTSRCEEESEEEWEREQEQKLELRWVGSVI